MFCLTFSIRLFKSSAEALFNLSAHCETVPVKVKRIYIEQGSVCPICLFKVNVCNWQKKYKKY